MSRFVWMGLAVALLVGGVVAGCGQVQQACGPGNCAGCCSLDGECQGGITEAACGLGGQLCAACPGAHFCISGSCLNVSGGSDGGTHGSDGGSGSDGGTKTDGGIKTDGGTGTDGGTRTDGGIMTDGGTKTDGGTSTCQAGGTTCTSYTQCCSLQCTNGVCAACPGVDQACGAGCCPGLSCNRGVCTACRPVGSTCSSFTDCCSGSCNAGVCEATCGEPGQGCSTSSTCCTGQSCPTSLGACCTKPGLGCTAGAECCSGVCTNNLCQPSAQGGVCGDSADCASGATCSGGQCCQPYTCAQLGKNCGSVPDGCGGTLNCGSCSWPATCGGGGTSNVCGCTPTTCAAQGKNCGSISDGCGGTLSCGTCTSPATCGGGGVQNVCGCSGTSCGSTYTLGLPGQSDVFVSAGYSRGFWFTAPTSFTITGLRVPAVNTAPQYIEVVRLLSPPPEYSATTNNFLSLGRFTAVAGTGFVSTNIPVSANQMIGILGLRYDATSGSKTSYGASPYTTQILGSSVTLYRLGMQYGLETTSARDLYTVITGATSTTSLGRIEVQYRP